MAATMEHLSDVVRIPNLTKALKALDDLTRDYMNLVTDSKEDLLKLSFTTDEFNRILPRLEEVLKKDPYTVYIQDDLPTIFEGIEGAISQLNQLLITATSKRPRNFYWMLKARKQFEELYPLLDLYRPLLQGIISVLDLHREVVRGNATQLRKAAVAHEIAGLWTYNMQKSSRIVLSRYINHLENLYEYIAYSKPTDSQTSSYPAQPAYSDESRGVNNSNTLHQSSGVPSTSNGIITPEKPPEGFPTTLSTLWAAKPIQNYAYTYTFPVEEPTALNYSLVARGSHVAGRRDESNRESYGKIFKGILKNGSITPKTWSLSADVYDPPDVEERHKRRVRDMVLTDTGKLIAMLTFQTSEMVHQDFIVCWDPDDEPNAFKRILSPFRSGNSTLSPSGRLYIVTKGNNRQLVVRDMSKNNEEVMKAEGFQSSFKDVRCMRDDQSILVLSQVMGADNEYGCKLIEIFSVPSGEKLHHIYLDDSSVGNILPSHFQFHYSTQDRKLAIVLTDPWAKSGPSETKAESNIPIAETNPPHGGDIGLRVLENAPFCAVVQLTGNSASLKNAVALRRGSAISAWISPDGSCFMAMNKFKTLTYCTTVVNIASGQVLQTFYGDNTNQLGPRPCFDFDGTRIYTLRSRMMAGVGVDMHVWEP